MKVTDVDRGLHLARDDVGRAIDGAIRSEVDQDVDAEDLFAIYRAAGRAAQSLPGFCLTYAHIQVRGVKAAIDRVCGRIGAQLVRSLFRHVDGARIAEPSRSLDSDGMIEHAE